jgi:ABC-type amino acid transport system permease subunit
MMLWLIGVAAFLLLWWGLWNASPKAGFGALIGFLVAWLLSWMLSGRITTYVTNMNEIPVWVPPLPFVLVVIAMFYFGIKTWINADNLPPPRESESDGDHGQGHH